MNSKNRTLIIVVAAVVVVLGLAGAAFLLTGGDDSTDENAQPVPTFGDNVEQNRPVHVDGVALPSLEMEGPDDPVIGMPAPVIDGLSFDLAPLRTGGPTEGPTLVAHLAHWCPHCNDEIPEILKLNSEGALPADLNVIAISTGVEPTGPNYPPSKWIVDKGWLWPTMADDADETAFKANGGRGYPYLLLLDEDGAVLSRISGAHTAEQLTSWLDAYLVTPA